jgi:6-phosphogluconolactonase
VLDIADADVAMTRFSETGRRMTLTFPLLNRARTILWIATGSEKTQAFEQLRDADLSIPAGRVRRDRAIVLADRAAAGELVPR